MRQKSITFRLPEVEYAAFTKICDEKGYSKTGKIREFIRNMVKSEIREVKVNAAEWDEIQDAIREIEAGHYVTFEDLKRDFALKKMAHQPDDKRRPKSAGFPGPGNSRKNPGAA